MQLELNVKAVLKVANPIMVGAFVQFILTFVDTAFLGHIGELELNVAGNAGLLYITMFLMAQGLSEALQILTTRRITENNNKALRNLFWNALFLLGLFATVSFVLVGPLSGSYLGLISKDQALAKSMESFLSFRSFGYFFSVTQLALIAFYTGAAQTKILAYSTMVMAGVNVLFDYLLIFGVGPFPEMGVEGAALASVIAEALSLLFCVVYVRRDKAVLNIIGFKGFTLVKKEIKALLSLGYPIMGQRFLAMISWTIFFFLIEKIGSHELAISQLIRSLYFLAFIPIMGFGITAKTYVSHYMARKQFGMVIKSIKYLCKVSLVALLLMIHGYLLYPKAIISILTDSQDLIADTAPVLQLIFFEAFIFMAAAVVSNAISGVGDSKAAFLIENLCIAIYLIATYFVTVRFPQPILYVWCMEFVYFTGLLILSIVYFKVWPWQKIDL